jgi:hypothetical protein
MTARLRDYRAANAAELGRVAVSAFEQYKSEYSDWPAMAVSRMSELAGTGEIILAEKDDKNRRWRRLCRRWETESRIFRSELADHSLACRGPCRTWSGHRTKADRGVRRPGPKRSLSHPGPAYLADHGGRAGDVPAHGLYAAPGRSTDFRSSLCSLYEGPRHGLTRLFRDSPARGRGPGPFRALQGLKRAR